MSAGTITLLIYIIVLVPLMLLGFYFARRKMFRPHHQMTMTLVVILNWILIVIVMLNSYAGVAEQLPENLSEPFALIPTIHGILGLTAQLAATYLVLLMWTENTALERLVPFRIKNIKTPMRVTLSLWLITVLFGFGVYGIWYGGSDNADDESPPPAVTEEITGEDTEEPVVTEDAPEPDATEDVAEDTTDDAEDAPEPDATEEPADAEDAPEPDATEESDG